MKFKNKIILTIDLIIKDIKKNIIEIILLILCFCLFSFGAMWKADRNKFRTEIEMVLNGGIDRTGLVLCQDLVQNKMRGSAS